MLEQNTCLEDGLMQQCFYVWDARLPSRKGCHDLRTCTHVAEYLCVMSVWQHISFDRDAQTLQSVCDAVATVHSTSFKMQASTMPPEMIFCKPVPLLLFQRGGW